MLVLGTPYAYEQADARQRVAASYALRPIDSVSWSVEVCTPAAWWQDTARQYPVVLDPTMYALDPIQVAVVYSGSDVCSPQVDPAENREQIGQKLWPLGWYEGCQGEYRLMVRFSTFPTLPANAQISKAQLLVAPTSSFRRSAVGPAGLRRCTAGHNARVGHGLPGPRGA